MNDNERAVVRDAAHKIVELIEDLVMPTTQLSLILHETTRLVLLSHGDVEPDTTLAFVGAKTAEAYAEGEGWARAVIDGPDEVHRAFHGGLYD